MLPKKLTCIAALLFFSLLAQAQIPDSIAHQPDDTYFIKTQKGSGYIRRFVSCDQHVARFRVNRRKLGYFQWSKTDSFGLMIPSGIDSLKSYGDYHVLKTIRGDRFVGKLIGFNGYVVLFRLEIGGNIYLQPDEIKMVSLLKDEFPTNTPAKDKLYYTPTAFMLKKGELEYRHSILWLYNSVEYGVDDHLTIGASGSILFPANMVAAKVKTGFSPGRYFHLGLGGHAGLGETIYEYPFRFAYGYGAFTVGVPNKYLVNLGVGRGVVRSDFDSDDEKSNQAVTVLNFGASIKISTRAMFFAEYILFTSKNEYHNTLAQFGISRCKANKRIDICFSFINDEVLLLFPNLLFSKRF